MVKQDTGASAIGNNALAPSGIIGMFNQTFQPTVSAIILRPNSRLVSLRVQTEREGCSVARLADDEEADCRLPRLTIHALLLALIRETPMLLS
jgi:hypothetical protein